MGNRELLQKTILKLKKYNIFHLSVRSKTDVIHTSKNDEVINSLNATLPDSNNPSELVTDFKRINQPSYAYHFEHLTDGVNMDNDSMPRCNEFGIQMVNEEMCRTLFKDKHLNIKKEKIQECLSNLKAHNLSNIGYTVPDVKLKLPELLGNSIEEHFYQLGEKMSSKYKNLILNLIKGIPKIPDEWKCQVGWTRYQNGKFEKVDFPSEDAIVFDVEVCCQSGASPTIATAVSTEAWYGWVSDNLVAGENKLNRHSYSIDDLIPLESSKKTKAYNLSSFVRKEKITIGHNVSYDRSKVKEQYWIEQSGMRFLDTLSMHVCVSGVTSYQKALLKAGVGDEEWSKVSSLNSLSKVHKLYCGTEISKEGRELFISGSLGDIKMDFQNAMHYCALDVLATFNVLKIVFPLFIERFPHPVTLAGMLELQSAYLPVNKNWTKYVSDANHVYEDMDMEAKCLMAQCANGVCELFHNEHFKNDFWLWDQDWSNKPLKLKNCKLNTLNSPQNEDDLCTIQKSLEVDMVNEKTASLNQKFCSILSKKDLLPSRNQHLPGYPEWYKKLCDKSSVKDWVPEPALVGTGLKITPKLMKLTWKSLPLHYEKGHGWGYLVPYKTAISIEKEISFPLEQLTKYFLKINKNICTCVKNGFGEVICRKKIRNKDANLCKAEIGVSCGFFKLPHKDGRHLNVGNPLAKDFITKFSENALSSDSFQAKRVIEINRMLSYWRNSKERVENQLVCWLKKNDLPPRLNSDDDFGAIIPQVVVCGTLTRRAVEPTWMTASNVFHERIGSELRAFVQAPPGYVLVGADVDSQELWIASLLGDAYAVGLHGATPLGWMTLNGQKSDETDMHSVTAKAVGISRNHAKILNYARIYGAGEKFAQRLLKQFNEDITSSEAIEKAEKMMQLTKGKRVFKLKEEILPYIEERIYTAEDAQELCKLHGKEIEDLFEKSQWFGGTESSMFNCLEMIASKPCPETPFLHCKLSRALSPQFDHNDKHLPTRINWVVQSGAVDFLHLMLVSMRWFLGPLPRFCLSFHDEVRYLVPVESKYQAALALHVTNLLTRAFCVSQVGMRDLPLSVAFFSSVEVDTVLRKDSKDDNKTPSNPFGLMKGYGIPLGESLDIYQSIEKANGEIGLLNIP